MPTKSVTKVLIVGRNGRMRIAVLDGPPPLTFKAADGRRYFRLSWGKLDEIKSTADIIEVYEESK